MRNNGSTGKFEKAHVFEKDCQEASLNQEAEPLNAKKRVLASPVSIYSASYSNEVPKIVLPDTWILVKRSNTRLPAKKKRKRNRRGRTPVENEPPQNDGDRTISQASLPGKCYADKSRHRIHGKVSARSLTEKQWIRVRRAKAEARISHDRAEAMARSDAESSGDELDEPEERVRPSRIAAVATEEPLTKKEMRAAHRAQKKVLEEGRQLALSGTSAVAAARPALEDGTGVIHQRHVDVSCLGEAVPKNDRRDNKGLSKTAVCRRHARRVALTARCCVRE